MKKLMCAAAALVAGVAVADVTSANIVGYQTKSDMVAGFNFTVPTFTSIGTSTVSIQDIKLSGEAMAWVDTIQILDENGNAVEQYLWDGSQWLETIGYSAADKTLKAGEGFLISSISNGSKTTYAGEVGKDDVMLECVAGFNFTGNSTPIAMDIQAITLSGAATAWVDTIQILDENGSATEQYLWDGTQWLETIGYSRADLTLAPGQGFLISVFADGTEVNIPAFEF